MRLVEAQLQDLVRKVPLAGRVGFVGGDHDVPPRATQEARDLPIDRREPLPDVEQQDDHLRLVDGDLGLRFDRGP